MWRKKLTVLLSSLLLALLLAELGVRLFASADYRHHRYWRYCQPFALVPGAVDYDARLGFFHRPNIDVRFANDEFDTRVRTNSLGFRDDEESLDKPAVLFLGDSFCFGWGVEQDETCESFFQERSGRKSLNMGVAGFHTVQEYLLYKDFSETHEIQNATVVLLVFCDDPVGSAAPFLTQPRLRKTGSEFSFVSPSDEFIYASFLQAHRKPWLKKLSKFSCLGDLAIQTFYDPGVRMRRFMDPPDQGQDRKGPVLPPPFETFKYVLEEMASFSSQRENRLLVALVPRLEDLLGRPNEEYRNIETILSNLDIPHLLLAEALNPNDYLPLDRHWNASGHRNAAEAIHRLLESPKFRSP